jgi:hypothetical protein
VGFSLVAAPIFHVRCVERAGHFFGLCVSLHDFVFDAHTVLPVCVCVCLFVCLFVCVCVYVCMYVCVYVCMCVCMY